MSLQGKVATVQRQKARRAVEAGRAEWVSARPLLVTPPVVRRLPAVEARRPATTPVRHPHGADRRFGEGLGARCPSYRSPVPISDMVWYEEQLAAEEERELSRRFAEYTAMDRLSNGLDPY